MVQASKALIDEFLSKRRIAVVGVSRAEKDFSRMLFRELLKRGYDAVAVNPAASEIEGKTCFRTVREIPGMVEAALIMTPATKTIEVVKDCAASGIRLVWMYRALGAGAVSDEAVVWCRENGVTVIAGHCPFMFLPDAEWFHRLHGFFARLTGSYPQ